ncbi:amine oxidase catalytic domain-containing protein [Cylindrobasidium torrendii FP15055 ss-10]|uniref:Amine oxidase n=1 Tax=Cylindrobasidium torrendii FP15055 ss-10 TaxID=1314674 RepID=A0A0D7BWI0_9AGAR|nr:amine oxidase catalytic domain-containing protein [Cylindrobasidium torrendii FP15055 ss-10]
MASVQQCPAPFPPSASPAATVNPWASLTIAETVSIQHWLEAPERGLNLTRAVDSSLPDNVIFMIETYYPPKEDAIAYLDNPGTVEPPTKYARVTIHHGDVPIVRDYLVGPLPVGQSTTMERLTDIYHVDDIPYHAAGYASGNEMATVISKITPAYEDALLDLFGGVAKGLPNDTLIAGASAPFSFDGSFRRMWVNFKRNVAGPFLHPLGFFLYIDYSGTDPSLWSVLKVVYNHQVFDSTEDFLNALNNGTLERIPHRPDDDNTDFSWTSRRKVGVTRDLDHLPGPRSVSFAGLRFRVDQATQYVTWMGWSMHLGFTRDMGLNLWNIGFKGERIIYELSPQEAIAQYGGNDPFQTTTAWLDRFFGMGSSVRDMLPGYDCPHEAVYLPATTYGATGSVTRKRAICIFEQDSGKPLTRHAGWMNGEFGAVKGYILTVRSISTVGNYDYCEFFDYTFHLDGTMEVRISASGYLQGGYWEPRQEGYGARIRDTTMGNLHDHVINFKVDFDIAGQKNSLLETTTAQEEVEQPWFDDDWGKTVMQQKITKRFIDTEDGALLKWPANFQGGYSVVNKDATNSWGYPRGYAVHPGMSSVHNTVVGSKRLLNNANWARYNMAVSKRKETEPSSSSMWNMNLPGLPVVDFHKFFDGESLDQEDVVAWINVGMHHLPQAEDSPNTKTNVATSSFILTPLNFFDSDPSMESANAILLSVPTDAKGVFEFDDYGVQQHLTCMPSAPQPFEYTFATQHTVDGEETVLSVEDMRKGMESYHRIKVEL